MLNKRYWRHSTATLKVYRCKVSEDWSPCSGGGDAGVDGDGYCAPGSRGPRCELCNSTADYDRYFEKLEARCHDCGDIGAQTAIAFCTLIVVLFAAVGLAAATRQSKGCLAPLKAMRWVHRIWSDAGLRFKVKALISLYQCVAAVPGVFDVVVPPGLEDYARWMYLLELPADLSNILIPSACFGSYDRQLLVGSCWPIAFLLVVTAGLVCKEVASQRRALCGCDSSARAILRRQCKAAGHGFQRALPIILLVTFVLVPSTATRIFKTFLCDPFEHQAGVVYRYLRDDLNLGTPPLRL